MKPTMILSRPGARTSIRLVTSVFLCAVLLQPAFAQMPDRSLNAQDPGNPSMAAAPRAAAPDVFKMIEKMPPSALLAVDQNRASIIDTIVNQWRTELGTGSDAKATEAQISELRESLSQLRADGLLAASNARTLGGLKYLFSAADAAQATEKATQGEKRTSDSPKALGSLTSDVVYTPITPCKLVDTRGTAGYVYAGGVYAASEKRTYNSRTGCAATVPNMAAILVSAVTSYPGAGGGILSMMANGAAPPLTNIFYSAYAPVTTIVPVNGTTPGGLFDVQISGVAGTALILEVVGYFAAPQATELDCYLTTFQALPITAGYNSYQFTSSMCGTGYTPVSAYCYDNLAPGVYLTGSGINGGAFCGWKNNSLVTATVSMATQCCRVPGR